MRCVIFGHVDENLTELACICTTVEMHVVYMKLMFFLRVFVHIRGIFATYTQVLKTVARFDLSTECRGIWLQLQ